MLTCGFHSKLANRVAPQASAINQLGIEWAMPQLLPQGVLHFFLVKVFKRAITITSAPSIPRGKVGMYVSS